LVFPRPGADYVAPGKNGRKIVKKLSNTCQKVVKKLSKSCLCFTTTGSQITPPDNSRNDWDTTLNKEMSISIAKLQQ
jgi:hypothetical protein